MPYTEAKEYAPGRLHAIFIDPYIAFDNAATERLLHLPRGRRGQERR